MIFNKISQRFCRSTIKRAVGINDINNNIKLTTHTMDRLINQNKYIVKKIENGLMGLEESKLSYLNEGNPQWLGQKPLSFNRQVMSGLIAYNSREKMNLSEDVEQRVQYYNENLKESLGAYSDSRGHQFIRDNVKKFIINRDQMDDNIQQQGNNIYLYEGALDCINQMFQCILDSPNDGCLIPVPGYPLYISQLSLKEGRFVPYYLEEDNGWNLDFDKLKEQLKISEQFFIKIKALVVCNPNNPTGSQLSHSQMVQMIRFCYDNQILIVADEVYQENIFFNYQPFLSFRKVLLEQEYPYNQTQLISMNSISKGNSGECGLRAGYGEFINFDQNVLDQIFKLKCINLCPNTPGQIALDLAINPPKVQDGYSQEIVEKHQNEIDSIQDSIKSKAKLLQSCLDSMANITCTKIYSGMYAFPRIHLSQKAIEKAELLGLEPDVYYCLEVLKKTGIILTPGSYFRQRSDHHHFRITCILNPQERFEHELKKLKEFNIQFHSTN